jgi:hypothetical protein
MTSIVNGESGLSSRLKLNKLLSVGINVQSGATYTLVPDDEFKFVMFANACTVTVPGGLGAGFSCRLAQLSGGTVTVVGGGAIVNSVDGVNTLPGQYASAELCAYATDVFLLSIVGGAAAEPPPVVGGSVAGGGHGAFGELTFG